MPKKKPDDGDPALGPPNGRPISAEAYSDDLTTAEILAQSPPAKPRRPRKRETSKSLGVYDARPRHPRSVPLRSQQDPAADRAAGDRHRQARCARATRRPCRSWSSATSGSSSRSPRNTRTAGSRLTDLIGEGNVGLLTAARKFDPDQGVKFISYAVWWIRQAILASLGAPGPHRAGAAQPHRRPLAHRAHRGDAAAGAPPGAHARGDRQRDRTLARRGAVARRAQHQRCPARRAARSRGRPLADRPLHRRRAGRPGRAGDGPASSPRRSRARSARCRPRDAKVLRLYFGLDGGREHTLEEIGGMLGVTRERVRQLRDRALKRLREGEVGRALASFAA